MRGSVWLDVGSKDVSKPAAKVSPKHFPRAALLGQVKCYVDRVAVFLPPYSPPLAFHQVQHSLDVSEPGRQILLDCIWQATVKSESGPRVVAIFVSSSARRGFDAAYSQGIGMFELPIEDK